MASNPNVITLFSKLVSSVLNLLQNFPSFFRGAVSLQTYLLDPIFVLPKTSMTRYQYDSQKGIRLSRGVETEFFVDSISDLVVIAFLNNPQLANATRCWLPTFIRHGGSFWCTLLTPWLQSMRVRLEGI